MINNISLKVYNKEGKLNLQIQDTDLIKTINLYKYDGESNYIHSFTYFKSEKKIERFIKNGDKYIKTDIKLKTYNKHQEDTVSYYDFIKLIDGIMVERIWITNQQMEHWEAVGYMEEQRIIKLFESGNIYEERKKSINGDIYTTEFKNGEFSDFKFKIPEIKINEYLNKVHYGK